ncbi:MAG: B12-binding domain-containing radical SAM protein [Proteobacteria bacterium]|nr:MAG: B12-binding domain-containing radical SAM protein [Pseudomonadota bacterium]
MNIEQILPLITRPGRYIGREYNVLPQKRDHSVVDWALVFPDLYEIGMSHQGLQILYHILNDEPGITAERCFCPDRNTETLLRQKDIPLFALESGRPLSSFDLIGITLPHELCYTNILTILNLSGIPFLARDRKESDPLVIGGGTCAFNPEPVADFFDAILIGDGEKGIVDISRTINTAKEQKKNRKGKRDLLATIDGMYIPSHFTPHYLESGAVSRIDYSGTKEPKVRRQVLPDLARLDHLKKPIVPNARIVHDRLGIEIARGCTRGCRFCQAGITYRPVRERTVDQIMELAETGIKSSGFDELALLSLSTGDYSCLSGLLPKLMNRYADQYVSVALPSMRVGTLTEELMDEIKRVRKTGFTLAPEAGSERLRQVINKGITEEDLLQTAASAFALGWNLIKLYFMIGLPTETEEDIDSIIELAKKTAAAGSVSGKGRNRVNVSIGTFVPKPHTPFQWERQITIEESRKWINRLKARLPRGGFKLKWHDPEQSYLEGVFARGDRRLSALIISSWLSGARLDSWSDSFNLACWQESAASINIDLDFYLRQRDEQEILPWHHIDSLVEQEYLLAERNKSRAGIYTPDCRYKGCQKCGLCDFKTIRPVVHTKDTPKETKPMAASRKQPRKLPEERFTYLVEYSRTGLISYLGHLEFLQIIFRALRRAEIKTHFSKGFNPSPKVSFGPALPVGTESLCEFFLMELPSPLAEDISWADRLSRVLPEGIKVLSISPWHRKIPQNIAITYRLTARSKLSTDEKQSIDTFLGATHFPVTRTRKGKSREINIRPLVSSVHLLNDTQLEIVLISRSGEPGIKPADAFHLITGREQNPQQQLAVIKLNWTMI